MSSELAAVLITATVTFGGSWLVARSTAKSIYIDALNAAYNRMAQLEGRVDTLEKAREADAKTKRRLGDYIDALLAHIHAGKGPPPPARPENI